MTVGFKVGVGLHQGSVLSSCLIAMVMDRLTDEFRQDPLWTMITEDGSAESRWRRVWIEKE